MNIYLNTPQIKGNRITFSWSPNRLFKENSYWIEYPDFMEINCHETALTEMYFSICMAFAVLGDVKIYLPSKIDERVLNNWEQNIGNTAKKIFRKKLNLELINGQNSEQMNSANKIEKIAILFGGGMESLTVLARKRKEVDDICLVSLGGRNWIGSDPDVNKSKFELDQKLANDLCIKLIKIRTNFRDLINDKAWRPYLKSRCDILNSALFLPFNIFSVNPIAHELGIKKVVSGNEKENDYGLTHYSFSTKMTSDLRSVSSFIEYESLLNDMFKVEIAKELYTNNAELVKYQYSCLKNEGQRWCCSCEKCFRNYIFLKLYGINLETVNFRERVLFSNLKHIIWKTRFRMVTTKLVRYEYGEIYREAKRLNNKYIMRIIKQLYNFYYLRKLYYMVFKHS